MVSSLPRGIIKSALALPLLLVLAGCSSSSGVAQIPTSTPSTGSPVAGNTWTDSVNPAALPLGDGRIASSAQAGYLFSCQQSFPPAPGAQAAGPWFNASAKTWDSRSKIHVQGSVAWPTASWSASLQGSVRVIASNDLPRGEPTGNFPVASNDPAFHYDRNPNTITAQSVSLALPATPLAAAHPSCVSLGPIGVLSDGVYLFNALDASGRDAVAHELQDACGGHPNMAGAYHYHEVSPCLLTSASGSATLVGYALDGYGIYVERNASGGPPTDADLDACHGRTSTVPWDGQMVQIYHYDATLEYPYTVGCYHGTPTRSGA